MKQWPNGLLAWFTNSPETNPVYHTCWACHERKNIEDDLVNVTLEQRLLDCKDNNRELCAVCEDYSTDVCCRSYPCGDRLRERLDERFEKKVTEFRQRNQSV